MQLSNWRGKAHSEAQPPKTLEAFLDAAFSLMSQEWKSRRVRAGGLQIDMGQVCLIDIFARNL
jgi:hypothetical protein